MIKWEIGAVDELIYSTLANDSTIKAKQGITNSALKARVAGYRVPRDPNYFHYIYYYSIPSPDAAGQGQSRIQSNIDYDIEVRTLGEPTDESEAVINRIDELVCAWKTQLTPDGVWMVAARRVAPIVLIEPGETDDIFYTRRGGTYRLQIVNAN